MRRIALQAVVAMSVLLLGGGLALGLLQGPAAGPSTPGREEGPATPDNQALQAAAVSPCAYSYGGCGGCGGKAADDSLESLKERVRAYHASRYGDADVSVTIRDYGCHQEATVSKDGVILRRFSISGDTITELG